MNKDLINILVNVLPIEDYDEITSYIARLEKENKIFKKRIDKTTNYYYKKLAECIKENKLMPDESVMMFNLLEGNK